MCLERRRRRGEGEKGGVLGCGEKSRGAEHNRQMEKLVLDCWAIEILSSQ